MAVTSVPDQQILLIRPTPTSNLTGIRRTPSRPSPAALCPATPLCLPRSLRARMHIRLPRAVQSPEEYLDRTLALLHQHRWLTQLHFLDYFIANYYDTTWPDGWKDSILGPYQAKDAPVQDMALADTALLADLLLMAKDGTVKDEWPESFKHFVKQALELRLPRNFDEHDYGTADLMRPICSSHKTQIPMKMKKKHEVDRLTNLVRDKVDAHQASLAMDIGAGQGYLTYMLAISQVPMVAVDSDSHQTCGSKARLLKNSPEIGDKVLHLTQKLDTDSLVGLVDRIDRGAVPEVDKMISSNTSRSSYVVTGLHACGDLSSAMVESFIRDQRIRALVGVGCCYNLLTEGDLSHPNCIFGFPLSSKVKSWFEEHDFGFGPRTRGLACQVSIEAVSLTQLRHMLEGTYYRSLLNYVFSDLKLDGPRTDEGHLRIKRLPHEAYDSFVLYAQHALSKVGMSGAVDEATLRRYDEQNRHMLQAMQLIYMTRALLGPIIENVILVDRALRLQESASAAGTDVEVALLNLFDAESSPRNMVLVAEKPRLCRESTDAELQSA